MRQFPVATTCLIVTLVSIGIIWRFTTNQTRAIEKQREQRHSAFAGIAQGRLEHLLLVSAKTEHGTDRVSSPKEVKATEAKSQATPDQVDWRQVANRVSQVKEQGDCGAGWAFAAAGVLEGQQVARNFSKKLVSLSVQNLIDCSRSNQDCDSGWVDRALEDMVKWGGLESESDYRYEFNMHKYPCRFNKSKAIMNAAGAINFISKGENHLKELVASFGPVAIGVCSANWHNYTSGVFDHTGCGTILNHAALVVGYGTDANGGGDFWIIKNSWGVSWGERGYIRVRRGKSRCGLGLYSVIPRWSS